MPVPESEIIENAIFSTMQSGQVGAQLRKVTQVEPNAHRSVRYLSKGTKPKHPLERWQEGHLRSSPPSMASFIATVDHLLTRAEIDDFIADGVLVPEDRNE
jgi:hypothetical protein